MKKTLIAAGIAAAMAAPSAFAEVKISGQLKMTFASVENGEDLIDYDNSLTFASSEDLGNGLTAFGSATLDLDTSEDAASVGNNKDMKLGLKGAFGTLVMGRMESLTEGKVSSKFDDGKASHGNAFSSTTTSAYNDILQLESSATAFGRHNAVAYISPTVNGFHAAAALIDNAATHATGGYFDAATEVLVAYDNGPLSIVASRINFETDTTGSQTGAVAPDTDSIVASYKMGDMKFTVGRFDSDDDNREDNIVRFDYKMGNNSLLLGYKDGEADNNDHTVISAKLTHSMSKQTAVWVGYRDNEDNNVDGSVGHVGMIHKF